MKNRTPAPPNKPIAFAPIPRRTQRHDGWTPERQRAFIEALADTGSVSRASAMVNMSSVGAYYLRRQPEAASFRTAWNAALDHGVQRMDAFHFPRTSAHPRSWKLREQLDLFDAAVVFEDQPGKDQLLIQPASPPPTLQRPAGPLEPWRRLL